MTFALFTARNTHSTFIHLIHTNIRIFNRNNNYNTIITITLLELYTLQSYNTFIRRLTSMECPLKSGKTSIVFNHAM